jgi:hypothetical protein
MQELVQEQFKQNARLKQRILMRKHSADLFNLSNSTWHSPCRKPELAVPLLAFSCALLQLGESKYVVMLRCRLQLLRP